MVEEIIGNAVQDTPRSASLRVEYKMRKALLQSLCDLTLEAEGNDNLFSLEEMVQRAGTYEESKNLSWCNWAVVSSLLEPYVSEGLVRCVRDSSDDYVCYHLENEEQRQAMKVVIAALAENLRSTTPNKGSLYKKTIEERVKEIRELQWLRMSRRMIAAELKTNLNFVIKCTPDHPNNLRRKKVADIQRLLEENNLERIYAQYSFGSPFMLFNFCEANNITIPKLITPYSRADLEIKDLVIQGYSSREIGIQKGYCSTWILNCLIGSGLYESGKQARQERIEFSSKRSNIMSLNNGRKAFLRVLYAQLESQAKEEGWAYEKAVAYWSRLNKKHHLVKPFSDYLRVFEVYAQAKERGERLSLEEIAQESNFRLMSLLRMLKAVGVGSMRWTTAPRNPKPVQEAIHRGIGRGLGAKDLMYFLDLSHNHVAGAFITQKVSHSPNLAVEIWDSKKRKNRYIPLCVASEVYEANDAGFELEEIEELLMVNRKRRKYPRRIIHSLLLSRAEVEPVLVDTLRELYNRKDLDKPYKVSGILEQNKAL
jgi:hypothetical protein